MTHMLAIMVGLAAAQALGLATAPAGKPWSADVFVGLLEKYSTDGRVDYARWKADKADVERLEVFVGDLKARSPRNHLEVFPDAPSQKAYYITAYNAWVVHDVLRLWPIASVMAVKNGLLSYVKPGAGFFYGNKIVLGGQETNLYDLENDVIRGFGDPRVHFAINCGSTSCPLIRPLSWTDADLDSAARDFIKSDHGVQVDDQAIWLSSIFDWYSKDFGGDPVEYVRRYASPALLQKLSAAQAARKPVKFMAYDWSVNAHPGVAADGKH